jgi:hypothetical protein
MEIDLLTTTFKKWDGTLGYARNSVIAPQYILNLRRSGPMAEVIGKVYGIRIRYMSISFPTTFWFRIQHPF